LNLGLHCVMRSLSFIIFEGEYWDNTFKRTATS
jgi:hypothetical protein